MRHASLITATPEECGPGRTCLGGQCEDDPCSGIECPANQRCEVVDGTAQCVADWSQPVDRPDSGIEDDAGTGTDGGTEADAGIPATDGGTGTDGSSVESDGGAGGAGGGVVPAVPAVTVNRAVMMEPLAVAAMSTLRTTPHPSRCYCYSALAHYAFADAKIA